jgi:hypothetical protein
MTCPAVIRGAEQWNRWSTDHSPLLKSEDSEVRSRLPGRGIRLLPVLRYSFIFLALCLLLSDTFRLAISRNSGQDVSSRTQPVRRARTVHGMSHARIFSAKRHSGV